MTRALAVGATLVSAKALMLAGQPVPHSVWAIPALVWQDVAVAVAFWAIDRATGRSRWMWLAYAVVVIAAAIDAPIARVLGSPLTVPMLRAAGGPLGDSIHHEATVANLAAIAVVLALGTWLPCALGRVANRGRVIVAVAGMALALAGPVARRDVDIRGLDRNAVTAILATATPRVTGVAAEADWRAGLTEDAAGEDLSRWSRTAAGRNVVVVVLESTAAGYLGAYGAALDPMPRLTALAGHAIVFDHAYTVYPESIKGLFAMVSSRYPGFDVPADAHVAESGAPLPRLLRDAGYRTALFHSGRFAYLGMDAVVGAEGFDTAEDAGAICGNVQSSFGVDEPSTVRRLLSWVDASPPDRPFFAMYLPVAGHHPYAIPEPGPFQEPGELGAYKNALHYADTALGELASGLLARRLLDRTLLIVVGDHGEAFGQHPGNFGHTLFIYDENVRVPLIVVPPQAPGHPMDAIHVTRVASSLDLAPTVLDLLGLPASPLHQGASLLQPASRMALFFTDYALGWLGLRDGCWKAIVEVESGRARLFDLCADPDERIDRSAEFPDRVRTYRDRLDGWSRASRAAIVDRRSASGGR
ncbi:MAG: sulfatase [Vicinamibacterales bacterium]